MHQCKGALLGCDASWLEEQGSSLTTVVGSLATTGGPVWHQQSVVYEGET